MICFSSLKKVFLFMRREHVRSHLFIYIILLLACCWKCPKVSVFCLFVCLLFLFSVLCPVFLLSFLPSHLRPACGVNYKDKTRWYSPPPPPPPHSALNLLPVSRPTANTRLGGIVFHPPPPPQPTLKPASRVTIDIKHESGGGVLPPTHIKPASSGKIYSKNKTWWWSSTPSPLLLTAPPPPHSVLKPASSVKIDSKDKTWWWSSTPSPSLNPALNLLLVSRSTAKKRAEPLAAAVLGLALPGGEGQKHLLQVGLVHAVLLHFQLVLGFLHDGEHVSYTHAGIRHLHVRVAVVRVEELGAGEVLLDMSHQRLDGRRVAALLGGHLGLQRVALAELGPEVLGAAQAHEAAVDHDGNAGAQCFTLLHAASRHGSSRCAFLSSILTLHPLPSF